MTVLFAESASARQVRPRGVFFTEPVAFGETIGVREIGSIEEPSDPEVFADLLARATVEMDEEEIREHLAAAAAVIHGTVVERHPVPGRVGVLSEHDPEWWIAVIHVEKSLKGGLKGDVRIRFPNSQDVRWYLTPKPLEGQEAIFVLHADGLGIGGTELAILHPNDMVAAHPDELDRHRRLI